jgi:hypothetical protein
MKASTTGVLAIALVALLAIGTPARAAEEDCETVLNDLNEAIDIATKNFETMLDELKKMMGQSADDKTKATLKNRFCSASGEMLGTSRAVRAVAGECGGKQNDAIATLEKSIKDAEAAIDSTCK